MHHHYCGQIAAGLDHSHAWLIPLPPRPRQATSACAELPVRFASSEPLVHLAATDDLAPSRLLHLPPRFTPKFIDGYYIWIICHTNKSGAIFLNFYWYN